MENAYTSQKLLEVFKKDKTYENAKNYIISFICEYTGKQGYYDYYKLNNEWESVFKMRYRGKINHFKFISSPDPITLYLVQMVKLSLIYQQPI